jgi:adenosylcobyric acid synthase
VGKSLIVAGLARAFTRRGLRVLPFKPQNMSNNAAVTADGGEIGRAQALQALAAGVEPHTDMNPVLLKPETDVGAQVIVHGKRIATARARDYAAMKPQLMGSVLESFERLKARADLVLVEGAGSPAEVNLRKADIANMGFARKADVPVVLIGDIDRGGVIAQLVGIKTVIDPDDAAMIRGFVINKFRGDPTLFDDGYKLIEQKTSWRGLGVLPWFARAGELPAEDALGLSDARKPGQCKIACLALSRIANFDDLDPLKAEPQVEVVFVPPGRPLPADAGLVVIPGSKSTIGDLLKFRENGWDRDLLAHRKRGGHVVGICGGFQMLGRSVHDPDGIEGSVTEAEGLGLLDVETMMEPEKTVRNVSARSVQFDLPLEGYEIHLGRTTGPDTMRPSAIINGVEDGAVSADGKVIGTYMHGLFGADGFRGKFLESLGIKGGGIDYRAEVERALDEVAAELEIHLDCDAIFALAR